jgi:tetratricopeptide (TPR) repeat protein
MKINYAIIVSSLEEKEKSLSKFSILDKKTFFTFDKSIKSLVLLKSKKNFFQEIELFFSNESFFLIYPDEELVFFDDEESFKSYHNLIVDNWIIKSKRSNAISCEVSKNFIRSNFQNVHKFKESWCNLYENKNSFFSRLEEYIFANEIETTDLFLIYFYIKERLKNEKYTEELGCFVRSAIIKYPLFIELINLWGDYLYENNLYSDAKTCYLNAIKMASHRQIYDFLPMVPNLHKKHPEKMLANIEAILKKYDNNLE